MRWLGLGTPPQQPALPTRTPLDILKEHFARSEIDKEEFEERKRLLEEGTAPSRGFSERKGCPVRAPHCRPN